MSRTIALAFAGFSVAGCFADAGAPQDSTTDGDTDATTGASSDASSDATTDATATSDATTTGTDCRPRPFFPDGDGDGHGAMVDPVWACEAPDGHVDVGDDCDDDEPARNPGEVEVCDALDNDCDNVVDEYSARNAACDGCDLVEYADSTYFVCNDFQDWHTARGRCQKRGADLVILASTEESTLLITVGLGLGDLWFGLSDEAREGAFVWVDGAPLDEVDGFVNWAPGEPNNLNDEDCVVMGEAPAGEWSDGDCVDIKRAYACEAPL